MRRLGTGCDRPEVPADCIGQKTSQASQYNESEKDRLPPLEDSGYRFTGTSHYARSLSLVSCAEQEPFDPPIDTQRLHEAGRHAVSSAPTSARHRLSTGCLPAVWPVRRLLAAVRLHIAARETGDDVNIRRRVREFYPALARTTAGCLPRVRCSHLVSLKI